MSTNYTDSIISSDASKIDSDKTDEVQIDAQKSNDPEEESKEKGGEVQINTMQIDTMIEDPAEKNATSHRKTALKTHENDQQ